MTAVRIHKSKHFTRNRTLRAILEDVGATSHHPLPLSNFVAGILTVGYHHRGKKSLSKVTHNLLRQLVAEGVFTFDEDSRRYSLVRKARMNVG